MMMDFKEHIDQGRDEQDDDPGSVDEFGDEDDDDDAGRDQGTEAVDDGKEAPVSFPVLSPVETMADWAMVKERNTPMA